MKSIKPSLAKGTRDFNPIEMQRRNFIFDTLKSVFRKYGYSEIQTPSFENLQTLMGKYGEEGDRLIFKILNSGEFLKGTSEQDFADKSYPKLTAQISEKALRYDLTVPFARYVVMHQNELTFPFKRFQIQPVWRADRPQRGRYREFYQCDVDVVGSSSLLNEAEFILIYTEALKNLGLKDFVVKLNNRKILTGIAEVLGKADSIIDLTVAIDKLDKIGFEGVTKELFSKGFTVEDIEKIKPIINLAGDNRNKLLTLKSMLESSEIGLRGIEEIEEVFEYLNQMAPVAVDVLNLVEVDITLARGLNYYTGCIFEVKTNEVTMGSIGGGGRYDDLTGMFGLKDLTGVGVSFGADRIYDVMLELDLFGDASTAVTKALIVNFDKKLERHTLPLLYRLRSSGIEVELYPEAAKLKKQMSYANGKNIPYVLLVGEEEVNQKELTIKNMTTGEQSTIGESEVILILQKI